MGFHFPVFLAYYTLMQRWRGLTHSLWQTRINDKAARKATEVRFESHGHLLDIRIQVLIDKIHTLFVIHHSKFAMAHANNNIEYCTGYGARRAPCHRTPKILWLPWNYIMKFHETGKNVCHGLFCTALKGPNKIPRSSNWPVCVYITTKEIPFQLLPKQLPQQ